MARPHHRKKHKQHLQQFKHRGDTSSTDTAKSKGSNVFGIGGAFFGLAIGYIASSGNLIWIIVGLILGAIGGYFLGNRMDASESK